MAVISAVNRMTRIHSFLVLAAICAVVADDGQEQRVNTDVALFEFELVDQCHYTAEAEWAFRTRSDLPGTVLENKIQQEQAYGDVFRTSADEVAPYLEQEWSDTELNKKLHLFSSAGDILIDKEKYDKEVQFSNSLQQIAIEPSACTKTPCQLDMQSVQHVLATSRDPERLLNTWTEYQRRFSSKIDEYLEILNLTKVAAEANGAEEVETYWEQQNEFKGGYTKALFLWKTIEPLYQKLHAFVSKQLSRHYVFLRSSNDSVIPVHVLGTVAGNDWTYIADHVLYSKTYQHMLASVKNKVLGGVNVYKAAENMITKLGLDPLPSKFWEQSWFNSSCPAHVVNYCDNGEARVITCNLTGWPQYVDAYETVMKVKRIQLAAEENTFIVRDNSHYSAIYESVTGVSALLATSPWYLQQLGVLTSKNNQQESAELTEASVLLLVALQTLPKLPYYLAADLWRLEVLSSNLTNVTELNDSWRRFRRNMQMVSVPATDETIFDFLSDPYIMSNKPYLGKFCGIILQFQLLEKVLGADMDSSEVDMTNIFTSNEDLKKLLHSGKSKSWPDLLEEVMEISDLDSGPLLLYFKKLESYLAELEQLEPIKPSRHVVLPTSTAAPSTVRILSETLNNTNLSVSSATNVSVNSNISSIEPDLSNESETKYGTGTIIVLVLACVIIVVIVISVVMFGRRQFRSDAYTPTSVREI